MTTSSVLLGIDVGASKAEWTSGQRGAQGRKFANGRVSRILIPKNCDAKNLLEIIRSRVNENRSDGVGISLPGFVVKGRLVRLPNLPNVDGPAFMAGLARLRRTGMPLMIENDVKCMALAEWAARGCKADDDFLLVAPGSGTGGAIAREGRLVRGAHNTAGEVGHLKVRDENGGWIDWEYFCSGFGIEKRWMKKKKGKNTEKKRKTAKEIFASTASDRLARHLVLQGADAFGAGLAGLANALDPAIIIVAGSVGKAYMTDARLRHAVSAAFAENAIEPVKKTPIRLSKVASPALRGAWLLAQGKKNGAAARFLGPNTF